MAIDNYASLDAQIKRWCARSDTTFSAAIPEFVGMAEDRLYNGFGRFGEPLYSQAIRSAVMESAGVIPMVDGSGALPADYLSMRKIFRSGDRTSAGLSFLPPERFATERANAGGGNPRFYTISNGFLMTAPAWSGDLEIDYYKRHPSISVTNQTGPLIAEHGYAYLEAALIEAFAFLQEADLALAHAGKLRGIVDGINRVASDLRFSGPLRTIHRRPMP